MKTLQLSDSKAKSLYPSAAPEFKAVLEESFGKDFFSVKITDRVKSYEDACAVLGIPSTVQVILPNELSRDLASVAAYLKLIVIARALNEGWEPDWSNSSQGKWVPYFEMSKSGFDFSSVSYDDWSSYTGVGSRLCFRSRELTEYAATQFADLYKDFITLK